MRLRMVPVRWVFQKMNRMVHDVSRAVGKDVVLLKSGEDTEMDRSIVEHIEEPLVHLIRNAIDHGIEPAAERAAVGKPAQAKISMRAFHEGGHIVIEITDDGRGIQGDAVLRRAKERGLVSHDAVLSEAQVFALIFAPGFSTATQVSELSGRGVGMDVVKRNVEALRGRVTIASQLGVGTTIRLVFPLTLAVIKGMLVSFCDERYIVPSLSIVESFKAKPSALMTVGGRHQLIEMRGELLPVIRLDQLFGSAAPRASFDDGLLVVVETSDRKLALWVQDVVTEQQIVIKPLTPRLLSKTTSRGPPFWPTAASG
jgi:two-component system chemotaxis sensor kinase CheA